MKRKSNFLIFILLIIFSLSFELQAQVIGKLYSKSDADNIYGPVLNSASINTSDLQTMLLKTQNYIMFSLVNGSPEILDNNRNSLYPTNLIVSSSQVFSLFSVSIVQELLTKGGSSLTTIENRQKTLTLTNGEITLEMGQLCPPFCIQ